MQGRRRTVAVALVVEVQRQDLYDEDDLTEARYSLTFNLNCIQ